MEQCIAITRIGTRCQLPAQSNGRCQWHGGRLPPATPEAPRPSDVGKWSKALPKHLLDRYSTSAADPQYRSLRDEIALLDARIEDLLQSLGTGSSPTNWKKLSETYQRVMASLESRNADDQAHAFTDLELLIAHGNADTTNWANIQALIEQRRRLIDCEQRGDLLKQMVIDQKQVLALTDVLLEIVSHHLPDPAAQAAISAEFMQILGLPSQPALSG